MVVVAAAHPDGPPPRAAVLLPISRRFVNPLSLLGCEPVVPAFGCELGALGGWIGWVGGWGRGLAVPLIRGDSVGPAS